MGMRIVALAGGGRAAEPCECQHERRLWALLERAQIPSRYAGCTLESFKAGGDLFMAANTARRFVEIYPGENDGTGLLFTGSIGVGKTHLATAILQKLILEKGVPALFCDYRELLKSITNSYNAHVQTTELEVLKPVFEAEVLVLDELGAAKPTEWVWETVAHILNTRYNDKRTTIITTNYPNLPPGAASAQDAGALARQSTREESLGDRIGERMRSRLQEMCVTVEMRGVDFRQTVKRARFA
jgi:DNA replication protein DnaC